MLNKLKNALLLVVGVLVAFWAVTALVDVVQGGDMDPPGAPGPTMLPLDEMPPAWHQILAANDGAAGPDPPAGCNSSRFECVMNDEAALDKETGLVWTRSGSSSGSAWTGAMWGCLVSEVGGRLGWRLPTMEELTSLVDPAQSNPALPNGHPFTGVQFTAGYWTATTDVVLTTRALTVQFDSPSINTLDKATGATEFWCVRGGQGYDGY